MNTNFQELNVCSVRRKTGFRQFVSSSPAKVNDKQLAKMKILVLFTTLICLATSAPSISNDTGLSNDIADFLEIVPVEKIKKIAVQHLHDDPEFQAAVQYIKGPEFGDLLAELILQPEVIALKNFLKDAGIDLDIYSAKLCSFLEGINIQTDYKERSLKKFIEEVRQIIPMAKLIEAYDNKMNTSPAFQEFYRKVTSEEAHQLISKVRALPVFKKIVAEFNVMGIDLDRIFSVAYSIFGWSDETIPPNA
ncbi:hypothetical protein Trydic_g882 [Trypoxylus dichotomus]